MSYLTRLTARSQTWYWSAKARDERGAAMVEYALLLALIAAVCVLAVTFFGSNVSHKFSSIGSQIS